MHELGGLLSISTALACGPPAAQILVENPTLETDQSRWNEFSSSWSRSVP